MGSARFGMVADSLSQGLGLFAGKKSDEEKAAAERQWQTALANQREQWAADREARQLAAAETRTAAAEANRLAERESDNKRRIEESRLAAERHTEILEQGGEQFDIKRADAAEEALFKRIDARYKIAQDEIENAAAMMDEGAEERILGKFAQERDEMILGHVIRLGERGAPGYEINDAGAFESKLIQMGMGPDNATSRTNELAPELWPIVGSTAPGPGGMPYAPGQPEVGGEPLLTANNAPPSPTQPGAQPTAAASSPASKIDMVDMVGNKGAVPPPATNALPQNTEQQPWGRKAGDRVNSFVDWMKKQGSPQGR